MLASSALAGVVFLPFLESKSSAIPEIAPSQGPAGSGLTHFGAPPPPCIPGCNPCFCCSPNCPPPCNPPALGGVQDTPSSGGTVAKISWTDNLGTSESFVYGLTYSYGSSATPSNHAVTLSGLQVSAVYYFKISASYTCSSTGKLESSSLGGSFWTGSTGGGLCPKGMITVSNLLTDISSSGTSVAVQWVITPASTSPYSLVQNLSWSPCPRGFVCSTNPSDASNGSTVSWI